MMDAPDNCAVRAIATITGEPLDSIAIGIARFPNEDGGPAFMDDGVRMSAVAAYLEARGWSELHFEQRPSIPWTCLLWVPGHAFAITEGRIHDSANSGYFGEQIISIFVPPPAGPLEKSKFASEETGALATQS